MEPMRQCETCGGWIRKYNPSTCTCGIKEHPDPTRADQIREEYGKTAREVKPYQPNRKQKRAQAAKRRKKR